MKSLAFGRLHCAAAFAGLVCCVPFHAHGADPWTKVPPLTTACYSGADPFVPKLEAATTAVQAERDKQFAANEKVREEYQNIEPMELANRMQQWMMSNPQEAMKFMERQQTIGNELQAAAPQQSARKMDLDEEKRDVLSRYTRAVKEAQAPARARWSALAKKLNFDETSPWLPESGAPDWAYAEVQAIQRLQDQKYQAICPQWWGATGHMHAYLKRYKDYLTTDRIPSALRVDETVAQQYAIMDTPAASWRSTAALDGVIDYLGVVRSMFAARDFEPRCPKEKCREGM